MQYAIQIIKLILKMAKCRNMQHYAQKSHISKHYAMKQMLCLLSILYNDQPFTRINNIYNRIQIRVLTIIVIYVIYMDAINWTFYVK